MLLHGGSAHARWWDFVAPALRDVGRPLALDLRGHGDSAPAPGAYSIAESAADVARIIDVLGLARPVLVGHSLGALVAVRAAADRPDGVAGLVVVDSRLVMTSSGARYLKLLRMVAGASYETIDEAVRAFQLLPKPTSAAPRVREHVARTSFRADARGMLVPKFDRESLGAHAACDLRPALRDLDVPVLVVRGEKSAVVSRAAAEELARSCRRGTFAEIAGAHHHVLLDAPERLAEEVCGFVRALGAGAADPAR